MADHGRRADPDAARDGRRAGFPVFYHRVRPDLDLVPTTTTSNEAAFERPAWPGAVGRLEKPSRAPLCTTQRAPTRTPGPTTAPAPSTVPGPITAQSPTTTLGSSAAPAPTTQPSAGQASGLTRAAGCTRAVAAAPAGGRARRSHKALTRPGTSGADPATAAALPRPQVADHSPGGSHWHCAHLGGIAIRIRVRRPVTGESPGRYSGTATALPILLARAGPAAPRGHESQKWEPTQSAASRLSATHSECSCRSRTPGSTQFDGDRHPKPP